jgi:hypothetical protein
LRVVSSKSCFSGVGANNPRFNVRTFTAEFFFAGVMGGMYLLLFKVLGVVGMFMLNPFLVGVQGFSFTFIGAVVFFNGVVRGTLIDNFPIVLLVSILLKEFRGVNIFGEVPNDRLGIGVKLGGAEQ